ncbi:glycosyltransferase [Adhaeribacter rhizoryzae]|uniref:Glycosyltransferase n=1 Tax=Adhaeribacter rhizoryzae TaxID=2607907 RepID=A0A5M6DIS1_9BACT|nr:glycosyltransferase [Adhaeribacter rhizoryzae]KAA5547391.1 glycosyltransferase [Adhaeribacter rhizoryzae]
MANIVIIGPVYPLRGGLATYNERLAKAFQEQGDTVEIITFSLQYPSFLFPGQTQYSTEAPPVNLQIKALINSVNPLSWVSTGLYLKKSRPDFIIFRFWLPFMGPAFGTIARLAAQNNYTRILALTDNAIPHEKRIGDVPFTKYFLSACQGFITMSRAVLQDLEKLQPNKPKVYHPHPLYDNFGEPEPKAEAIKALGLDPAYQYLLFFGFIRAYKGLDLLLEAFADERLQALPVKLIIAGEFYEDAQPYEQIIKKYNLEHRLVRATEFIPNSQVVHYFCAADLVVQPYKHATQSGVSQIAYHFNKPMLVTDVGGLAELIPDGKAGYVTAAQPQAIADALLDFYTRNREAKLVANIPELKKQFSWESMVSTMKQLAQSLAPHSGNSARS